MSAGMVWLLCGFHSPVRFNMDGVGWLGSKAAGHGWVLLTGYNVLSSLFNRLADSLTSWADLVSSTDSVR